jgi:DNA repair exonuclease SbcCD ATPase subunit
MIVFEKIRWKNFLSTGNAFTELSLNESKSHLIVGQNGAGKSTILDALCFGLFNKPFRKINKPQLINSINERDCVVEVEFRIGNVEYKVVRGIKPNVFEIYRNGTLIDQDAANRDYQKYLEQSILKFNFKSFTQVVILGSSTFVPFMQLPAAHRREVIEDLLDIQIFSRMNTILKDRIKDAKDSVVACEHEYNLAEQRVNIQRKSISNLEKLNSDFIKGLQVKFDENELRYKENLQLIDDCENTLQDLNERVTVVDSLERKTDSLKDMRSKIEQNLNKAVADIRFYRDNDVCPTCSQTLQADHKKSKLDDSISKETKFREGLSKITDSINDVYGSLKEVKEYQDRITSTHHKVMNLHKDNMKIMKDNKQIIEQVNRETPDIDNERKTLVQFETDLNTTQENCANVNIDYKNLVMVSGLLKDGGIKTKIISKFIPVINKQINKYLQSMDFFVGFTLDEEFNEIIKSRFRDEFSYASFSEGEKQKIDLALLFTWRDIARMKNSASTNLLILDEVFDSSLDSSATDELMKILKGLDKTTNLFVISHKGEVLLDKFDTTLRFEKQNDFSKVTIDESP